MGTSKRRKTVVLSLLGTTLDAGRGKRRWDRWRPTVDICRQADLVVDRLELLHQPDSMALARVLCDDLGQVSPETKVQLHEAAMRDPWDFELVYATLLDFARAYPFDTEREDYLVHITTGTHVAQICLFLLTESRELPARLLQTSPPPRSRASEPGEARIIDLDLSKYDQIASRVREQQRDDRAFLKKGIATKNVEFNRTIEEIEEVSIRSRAPLLLMGPTGVGKTQLARRIYELKQRRHQVEGPFMEVNCATLRGDHAMSTLFGHVRGSFTGAVAHRTGLLKLAENGVLFLDEIGELGPDEQAMLLTALEDKRFFPLGSDRPVHSDFQLMAGTNQDLDERARRGGFRADLLARINMWAFELPPLCQRVEDIEPNLDFELLRHAEITQQRVTFARRARTSFLSFATSSAAKWPGNFRDFSASVHRMATMAEDGRIPDSVVAHEIDRLRNTWSDASASPSAYPLVLRHLGMQALNALDIFDLVQLQAVLEVCCVSASLSAAGRTLFAASRQARTSKNDADRLRKYLARYELSWLEVGPAAV